MSLLLLLLSTRPGNTAWEPGLHSLPLWPRQLTAEAGNADTASFPCHRPGGPQASLYISVYQMEMDTGFPLQILPQPTPRPQQSPFQTRGCVGQSGDRGQNYLSGAVGRPCTEQLTAKPSQDETFPSLISPKASHPLASGLPPGSCSHLRTSFRTGSRPPCDSA